VPLMQPPHQQIPKMPLKIPDDQLTSTAKSDDAVDATSNIDKTSQENLNESLVNEKSNLVATEEISNEKPASTEEPQGEQEKEQLQQQSSSSSEEEESSPIAEAKTTEKGTTIMAEESTNEVDKMDETDEEMDISEDVVTKKKEKEEEKKEKKSSRERDRERERERRERIKKREREREAAIAASRRKIKRGRGESSAETGSSSSESDDEVEAPRRSRPINDRRRYPKPPTRRITRNAAREAANAPPKEKKKYVRRR
jgi:nucleolin